MTTTIDVRMMITYCVAGILLLINFVSSYPTFDNYHRKSIPIDADYVIPLMRGEDTTGYGDNEWEMAQDPYVDYSGEHDYYSLAPDPGQLRLNTPDIELLSDIFGLDGTIPNESLEPEGTWGRVIREKPETELEELKHLAQTKRSGTIDPHPQEISTSTLSPPTQLPKMKIEKISPIVTKVQNKNGVGSYTGQKEVPLLRPPIQSTNSILANGNARIDGNEINQKFTRDSQKQPSAYDTLRKYLSIEDALKKEAEKRMKIGGGGSRQIKRSFISETDSLSTQLTKLRKTD